MKQEPIGSINKAYIGWIMLILMMAVSCAVGGMGVYIITHLAR